MEGECFTRRRINTMKSFYKVALMTGLTLLSFGMPALAQIANGVDFTTSFPFYAGNAKMPDGAYTITQPPDEEHGVADPRQRWIALCVPRHRADPGSEPSSQLRRNL
jgi:hypothetical protein